MEKLQFVIPIFNEEECADVLVGRLLALKTEYQTEFIFVDDGSRDRTAEILIGHSRRDPRIKLIRLSRNFGHQMALTAGLDHCDADYVAIIDGDLQDPPEIVPQMLAKLKAENLDLVFGHRVRRNGETFFKKLTASMFYRFLSRMCNTPIPRDTGDFRVINRKVLEAFADLRERHRFIRGMIPWLGFRAAAFDYERDVRYAGQTKYPFAKMFKFAIDAILSFSNQPLRAAIYVGVSIVGLGILGSIYMLYLKLVLNQVVPGITAVLIAIVIIGGVQILLLGVVGEYIGRIFEEVKGRPLYVVDTRFNVERKRG